MKGSEKMNSKNKTIVLLLAVFFGYIGIHRFYVGKVKSGILYLLTGGIFGIGWLVDIILIATDKFGVIDADIKSKNAINKISSNGSIVGERIPNNNTVVREEIATEDNISLKPVKQTLINVKPEQKKSYRTIHSKLSGVTKKNEDGEKIQLILADLYDGCELELVREPDNQYDANAIKVYAHDEHIGYINAQLAKDLARKMDNGINIEASIDEITGGEDGHNYGCNIIIKIQKDEVKK